MTLPEVSWVLTSSENDRKEVCVFLKVLWRWEGEWDLNIVKFCDFSHNRHFCC
jgi:hypothetical protein